MLLQLEFAVVLLTQTMAYATGGKPGGSGTAADPFLVADYADLKVVGTTTIYSLSSTYRLAGDIDASTSVTENSGAGFVPIGSGAANFTGTFHGAGHVIQNLHINRSDTDFVALFGCAWTATIDSLGVTNLDIKGRQFVAGIVGSSYSTITNCYSTGNVIGHSQVGGVVGMNVGQISNCYAVGNMIAIANVGGVVGYSNGIVSNCYSTGNVTGSYQVGGVVGDNDIGLTTNCYSTGIITGIDAGGVAGLNGNSGTVSNCYAIGTVSGSNKVGGVVGEIYNKASVSSCYWNTQTTGMFSGYGTITDGGVFSGSGLTTVQMKLQSSFSGWDFTTVWSIDASINNGYPYLAPVTPTSVEGVAALTPTNFSLLQNFPNPFNPATTIRYGLPASSRVSLRIYNILGQQITELVNSEQSAGWYVTVWNANVASGLYFYRIDAVSTSHPNQRFTQMNKMMLLK